MDCSVKCCWCNFYSHDDAWKMQSCFKCSISKKVWICPSLDSLLPFKSSIRLSPSPLNKWSNKNVLHTTNAIAKGVTLGVWNTYTSTKDLIFSTTFLHLPWSLLKGCPTCEWHNTSNICKSTHKWTTNHKIYN
jgi:hypothetical protein